MHTCNYVIPFANILLRLLNIFATQRLIDVEGHLIVVDDGRQAAARTADAAHQASVSRDDRILAVAPNFVID